MAQPLVLSLEPELPGVAIVEKATVEHFEHQIQSPSSERTRLIPTASQEEIDESILPEDSVRKNGEFKKQGDGSPSVNRGERPQNLSQQDGETGENVVVKEIRKYTMDEIARHNTIADMWVVIDSDVYDVTEFQHKHPGGYKVMKAVAGKDATKKFDKYHRRAVLVPKKETLLIGTVDENTQPDQAKHSRGFLRRLGFGSSK